MLSICESTNFLLVSATVTTSTIEALPMMTPSEVSIARSLFARSAAMATVKVSWKSIMALVAPQALQCFVGEPILRFQVQRLLIFPFRGSGFVLIFLDAAQPIMRHGLRRVVVALRRVGKIVAEQSRGVGRILFFKSVRHGAEKISARVGRGGSFSLFNHELQTIRLVALHVVIADIVNQVGGFWMESERFAELAIRSFKIFFLPAAISRSVAPLRGIESAELFDFGAGFVFASAGNSRRAAIELDQRLHRGEIALIELHRCFKFLACFLCNRQNAS